jgi:hypothetical protein
MEQKEKKTLNHYMRALHRDIGYFTIGLIIIYSISGIALIYRDTNFLKHDIKTEKKLSPNMADSELSQALRIRDFKITNTNGETIYFQNGSYNKSTGVVTYTTKETIFPINKFIDLHKTMSNSPIHYFNALLGLILLFLALSSFWMFKKGTKFFHRGIYLAGAGIVFTIIILLI